MCVLEEEGVCACARVCLEGEEQQEEEEEEEEEEECTTSGDWRGKRKSLSRGAGADHP